MIHSTDSTPNPQVNNWQELDLSTSVGLRALEREIAARLGWTFEYPKYLGQGSCLITDTDGQERGHQSSWGWTRVFAEFETGKVVPRYTNDLNAAFSLANAQTHIRTRRGAQDEQIWGVSLNLLDEVHQDTSLALAICKAWLSWHDWRSTADETRAQAAVEPGVGE